MPAEQLLRFAAEAVLLGYLPGALLFRLPMARRERRAALTVEERAFWAVTLSVGLSLGVGLALALLNRYTFARLLIADAVVCAAVACAARGGLAYRGSAARPTWHAILPLALVAIGCWRFFPPSEYIIGGKDPGVYINEGMQIAQQGSIFIHDPVVAAVPANLRDLFIPRGLSHDYYSLRFMGFFVQDPSSGTVIGQLPHLFPMSIAIGDGMRGLTGGRETVEAWAILGLLAVYFLTARLAGRPTAIAASLLLALNIIQVWFARYPNAEILMQPVLFAALLAFARAHQDGDRFFAPVSGLLLGLLLFLRIDALLAIVAIVAVSVLLWIVERASAPRVSFFAPLAAVGVPAWWYLRGPMRAYLALPDFYLTHLPAGGLLAGLVGAAIAVGALALIRRRYASRARAIVPIAVCLSVLVLAADAWFFRHPTPTILGSGVSGVAAHDAYALRMFVDFYLWRPAFIAALVGIVLLVRRDFWRDPAFLIVFVAFSFFFFYKIRIVTDHFWMARRFVPIILPGACVFIAAAGTWMMRAPARGWRVAGTIAGAVFLVVVGQHYVAAAAPVIPHIEYAGVIPYVEKLAANFTDRDLILVESANASDSDVHVFAAPLAYIYHRHVLVLSSPKPDKTMLRAFLTDALTRYANVYFIGGGGTDLLSRSISAQPVASEHLQVPEFGESVPDVYPQHVHMKEFDYSIYRLHVGAMSHEGFSLDVGVLDDLNVVRFNSKETSEGRTIRWTGRQSYVEVPGLSGRERELTLVMHDGGRPAAAPKAQVTVYFNDTLLGTIDVTSGFRPYRLAIPADVMARAGAMDDPSTIKLVSTVWVPHDFLPGNNDTRQLGVMLDRVEVR